MSIELWEPADNNVNAVILAVRDAGGRFAEAKANCEYETGKVGEAWSGDPAAAAQHRMRMIAGRLAGPVEGFADAEAVLARYGKHVSDAALEVGDQRAELATAEQRHTNALHRLEDSSWSNANQLLESIEKTYQADLQRIAKANDATELDFRTNADAIARTLTGTTLPTVNREPAASGVLAESGAPTRIHVAELRDRARTVTDIAPWAEHWVNRAEYTSARLLDPAVGPAVDQLRDAARAQVVRFGAEWRTLGGDLTAVADNYDAADEKQRREFEAQPERGR